MNKRPQDGNAPANIENESRKTQNLSPKIRAKYTLAPLVEDGRKSLVCSDVEGIEVAILESVEFYYGGTPWQRITRKSNDILALVENDILKWPKLERISAARFQIRLKGEQRARSLTVRPCAGTPRTFEGVRLIMEEWLVKRKFLEVQNDEAKSVE